MNCVKVYRVISLLDPRVSGHCFCLKICHKRSQTTTILFNSLMENNKFFNPIRRIKRKQMTIVIN